MNKRLHSLPLLLLDIKEVYQQLEKNTTSGLLPLERLFSFSEPSVSPLPLLEFLRVALFVSMSESGRLSILNGGLLLRLRRRLVILNSN